MKFYFTTAPYFSLYMNLFREKKFQKNAIPVAKILESISFQKRRDTNKYINPRLISNPMKLTKNTKKASFTVPSDFLEKANFRPSKKLTKVATKKAIMVESV